MSEDLCPLCGRELTKKSRSGHHLIPKQYKGKEIVDLHLDCHNKIHSLFTEKELAKEYNTTEKLLEHKEIIKFVKWIKNKDPNQHFSTRQSNRLKSKRRR